MNLIAFSLLFIVYLQIKHVHFVQSNSNNLAQNFANLTYFQSSLDGSDRYRLFWRVDYEAKSVDFEVRIKLKRPQQWFAIGFSDYGHVSNSDLCILWLDFDLKVHFEDTFTDKRSFLNLDTQNDCQLLKHKQTGKHLRFLFQRDFDTCDVHDKVLEDGTVHVLWATGPGPIEHAYGLNLADHEHGFRRLTLLKSQEIPPPLPVDTKILEFKVNQVRVPSDETTYWCKLFQFPPELVRKHHIIRYESVINRESSSLVHHMELFHCEVDSNETLPDWNAPCFDSSKPAILQNCKKVLAAWAMGAEPFSYPAEAGSPFGGSNYSFYVMLEIHYNNPDHLGDLVDNSGLKIYYTPTLRQYDVGVLEIGLEYTDKNSIPPRQEQFDLHGYCVAECTRIGLPENGITIFASQLHTHLTGVRVWTQHIRGGIELPEINRDNHFSQHFQEIRYLRRKVKVLPGDVLINNCRYKTSNRSKVTLGGYGIRDEMCVNYIHYYPKSQLEVCKSSTDTAALMDYFQYLQIYEDQKTSSKQSVASNYNNIHWSQRTCQQLAHYYDTSPLSMQCNKSSGDRFPGNWEGITIPEVRISLTKKRLC